MKKINLNDLEKINGGLQMPCIWVGILFVSCGASGPIIMGSEVMRCWNS
jgi:hypothetical protein